MLYVVGGAEFLSDFALALMGRFRGGQAKIAIVSSSLFGNISGSAVANVVVDGVSQRHETLTTWVRTLRVDERVGSDSWLRPALR